MSDYPSKTRWDAENTVKITMKLNRHTDADILRALPEQGKQTYIKAAIRAYIEKEQPK